MSVDIQEDKTKERKDVEQEQQNVIKTFYEAFQNRDAETMASCYHENVVFQDPAFGILEGARVGNMWRMLCGNATDLKVEFSDVTKGSARWEAWYTFSQTGRKVHNEIEARFTFQDGKIIRHEDQFNLHKWANQAIGFKGWLLGGTEFFKKKLQAQTNRLLDKFEKNR